MSASMKDPLTKHVSKDRDLEDLIKLFSLAPRSSFLLPTSAAFPSASMCSTDMKMRSTGGILGGGAGLRWYSKPLQLASWHHVILCQQEKWHV